MRGWIVGMLLGLGLVACGDKTGLEVPLRAVLVEPPRLLEASGATLFPGTVVAREDVALGFRIAGKLVERKVDAGDRVKAGQVLARMDPEDVRLAANAAEAAVRAAESDLRLAEAELKRHRELLDRQYISASAYELRENQHKLAAARLNQAKAEYAVSRNQRGYTELVADRDGLITQRLAEPGQVLTLGQPVLRFVPDDGREVEIQVPEGRLDPLRRVAGLQVRLWALPDRQFPATVREITPQADPLTRTHRVRLALQTDDPEVALGMTASAFLQLDAEQPVFGIPTSALGSLEGQAVVWSVDDAGTVQPSPVTVLRYTEQGAVVSGALSAEVPLVSAGVHLLTPGLEVSTIPRRAADH